MTLPDITAWVILATTVLLTCYDIWVKLVDPSGNSTLSWVVLTSSKKWPAIAFAAGFLCGHLFFQNCAVP